jgi:hypothetical protein
VKASVIGRVKGRSVVVRHSGREVINVRVDRLLRSWKNAIPQAFFVR